MLRLTRAQLNHFADQGRDRFVRLMMDYLRKEFSARVASMDDTALESWTRRALAKCERCAVVMEPEAAQLILLLLLLGVDADESEPWVAEALSGKIAGVGKVRRLVGACRSRRVPELDEVLVFENMAQRSSAEAR